MNNFSVIIPTLNRGYCLNNAIESCLKYELCEIVIIDDGSVDNTSKILQKYSDNKRIIYKKNNKNMGQNYCRNLGMKLSTNDIVTILDSDDELLIEDLDKVFDIICEDLSKNAIYFTPVKFLSKKVSNNPNFNIVNYSDYLKKIKGEYAAFIVKSKLRNEFKMNFFVQIENCKRSCTDLTFLKYLRKQNILLINYQTRLYNDIGTDRISNKNFSEERLSELIRCNLSIFLQERFFFIKKAPLIFSLRFLKIIFHFLILISIVIMNHGRASKK